MNDRAGLTPTPCDDDDFRDILQFNKSIHTSIHPSIHHSFIQILWWSKSHTSLLIILEVKTTTEYIFDHKKLSYTKSSSSTLIIRTWTRRKEKKFIFWILSFPKMCLFIWNGQKKSDLINDYHVSLNKNKIVWLATVWIKFGKMDHVCVN